MVEVLQQVDQKTISTALHNLVTEQGTELQFGSPPSSFETRKQLLSGYKQSSRFQNLFQKAVSYHLLPLTDDEVTEIRSCFAEGIFQDLGFSVLASQQPPDRMLLSPERTLRFYQVLYPKAQLIEHPFNGSSLAGISVPDGLIAGQIECGQETIMTVCEYTTYGRRNYFESKYLGFRKNQSTYSQFFAGTELLFVVPETNVTSQFIERSGAKLAKLPLRHDQLTDFIDSLYQFYCLDPDGATLADFQSRARLQRDRLQQRQAAGKVTPQYQRYYHTIKAAHEKLLR